MQLKSWSKDLMVFLVLSKDENWKVIHKMELLASHVFLTFYLFMLRIKKETKNGRERRWKT